MTQEVLKISDADCEGGFRIINKSDYDEKEHTLYEAVEPKKRGSPAKE